MERKRLAFFCTQGTLILKDDAYLQEQGNTPEEGGQVIYTIEMARALAALGYEVDIFARNYHGEEIVIETDPNCSGVRVFHIPTQAPASVQKETFYRYYPEYLGRTIRLAEELGLEYDGIVGHYADGMTIGAGFERYYAGQGKPTPLIGVTHSLGLEKAEALHENLMEILIPQAADHLKQNPKPAGAQIITDAVNTELVTLRQQFKDAAARYNIKPRLGCELSALSRIDGVACVSKAHLAMLFDHYAYPEDQMAVIPGGANQTVFRSIPGLTRDNLIDDLSACMDLTDDRKKRLRSGKLVMGFGRFVAPKGIFNAVRSMEHLLKAHPDSVYLYVGGKMSGRSDEEETLYRDCMDYAGDRDYADRLFFPGRQKQIVIAPWLNVASVYAHCAFLEPWGLAPGEAASTGVPTVISKEAGISELLENNIHTLHTNPHSPQDIAKQVGRILANPALGHRLSKAAVQLINTHASYAQRAQQLIDFLEEEIRPVYFQKRQQRERSENRYASFAQAELSAFDPENLPSEIRPYAKKAGKILTRMVALGLPANDTREMDLEFAPTELRLKLS